MFTCDLKEARHGKVYIENISPWTMKRLLDFIYTGRIEISPENVIDLFNAALLFQLHAVVDKCTAYIQANIDLTNCVEINLFASMHDLSMLEACTFKFMLENFMQLVNMSLTSNNNNNNTQTSSSSSTTNAQSSSSSSRTTNSTAGTPISIMNSLLNEDSTSTQRATTSNSNSGKLSEFIVKNLI